MKFFVDVRPISGRSVAFGTGGFVVTRARRSNESLTVARANRNENRNDRPKRFSFFVKFFFFQRETCDDASSVRISERRGGWGWIGVSRVKREDEVSRVPRRAKAATTAGSAGETRTARGSRARRVRRRTRGKRHRARMRCGRFWNIARGFPSRHGARVGPPREGVHGRETLGRRRTCVRRGVQRARVLPQKLARLGLDVPRRAPERRRGTPGPEPELGGVHGPGVLALVHPRASLPHLRGRDQVIDGLPRLHRASLLACLRGWVALDAARSAVIARRERG